MHSLRGRGGDLGLYTFARSACADGSKCAGARVCRLRVASEARRLSWRHLDRYARRLILLLWPCAAFRAKSWRSCARNFFLADICEAASGGSEDATSTCMDGAGFAWALSRAAVYVLMSRRATSRRTSQHRVDMWRLGCCLYVLRPVEVERRRLVRCAGSHAKFEHGRV